MSEFFTLGELEIKNDILVSKGKQLPKEYRDNGTIEVIGAGRKSPYFSSHTNYDEDTITISSSGAYAGYVWLHTCPIWASDCTVIRINENIDLKYLYSFLLSKQQLIYSFQSGAGQPHVYWKNIKKIEIPLPTLIKQKQIAKTLDKAKELIELRQDSISKLDELSKSIFIDMFGDSHLNPKNWKKSDLSNIVDKETVVTYGIVQAGEEYHNGVPYIRTGDITKNKIKLDGLRHTDPLIAAKFKRSCVRSGEIVMSIRATVGTIAFVPKELDGANLTQGTARISPGCEVNSQYLFYFIQSVGCQFWIQRQVKGATFKEITLKRLREMPVLVPPLELQNKFAKIAEKIEQQKSLYQEELTKLQENFDALLSESFSV